MVNSSTNNNQARYSKSPGLGFTLIELMIVTAIIGVLAAIAYPSYKGYTERTNRADAMTEMQQIAGRIEANKLSYKRYDKIPIAVIFSSTATVVTGDKASVKYPTSGTALYDISIGVDAQNRIKNDWVLTATPISNAGMRGNGDLTLKYNGEKCWKATGGNKCGMADEWRGN